MNKIKMTKDVDLLKARVEALEGVEVDRIDRKTHNCPSHYDFFTIHSTDGMFFVNARGKRIEYCPMCGERLINS